MSTDQHYMRQALQLAAKARDKGEVPVGAVVVHDDQVIGKGFNQPISSADASAHAEIVALRAAGVAAGNYRLVNTTLYVTIEPCMMCAGMILHSRVARLVYGAREPKAGAVHTHELLGEGWHNHVVRVDSGVLEEECAALMREFFLKRRSEKQTRHDH